MATTDTQRETESARVGEVGLVEHRDFVSDEPFHFEKGGVIPRLTLRYETYGYLNHDRSNAILICHALSGDHHCAGVYSVRDRKPGWWNHMIGPGKPIDTLRYFVICSNCLGGCQGSTGPCSVNPETGKPYNLAFPKLTIRDMVAAQARLIDHLGIDCLRAVVGGSMGGMQALQWAIDFPGRVDRFIALASGARQSTQAIAFNHTGRQAIVRDPEWNHGDYAPEEGPNHGLAVARMMAHITYLSDKGMETKFGRQRRRTLTSGPQEQFDVEFEIESYLRYQGESFVSRFDANTYLYFTKALDRFDLYDADDSLDTTLAPVEASALIVGFTSDWLYPPSSNQAIAEALLRQRKDATYAEVEMDFGHDSFLVNSPELFELMRGFLDRR